MGNDRVTFDAWKELVNRAVAKRCGLSCDDLPDCDYWEMWNDGTDPSDAATEVLDAAGFPGLDGLE